jgi:hypothetical protein
MIVIGVDVHKQSLTAVAVDEAGRSLAETTVAAANGNCSGGRQGLALTGCGRWRIAGS